MELTPFFLKYWYFHIPNYALAVLIYTLMGRFLLGLMMPPQSANYIWRFFLRITDPILRLADWLIPRMVAAPLRPLAAAFHLFVLRLVFWIVLAQNGLAPNLGGPS